MASQIKYLIFKGIEKKEQILFKSFLNLAKNELDYQVVILKEGADTGDAPDIVIMDETYVLPDEDKALAELPTIVVGESNTGSLSSFIERPVQWSDFKLAFTALEIELVEDDAITPERVLPGEMKFAIKEMGAANSEEPDQGKESSSFSDEGEYDYELDHMSIDYHSFTNSDYMKVVDDVKQFREGEEPQVGEPVILVTDDESASANSVLVIETNTLDAWEFTHSEISADVDEADISDVRDFEGGEVPELVLEQKAGFEISPFEAYWQEDNEIIADHETVLYIKAERDMVYSAMEPAKWQRALQNKALSKLPLNSAWKPKKGLNVYPMSRLFWVNTLINETESLHQDLDEGSEYILSRWPHFDLLELDNNLLKLCTMLFVKPESLESLTSKSGYGRSTIRGLMNACYREGILHRASDIDIEDFSQASNDEGVFGKIKDVFR